MLWRQGFVFDHDCDFGETRGLDFFDDFMDPFALDKRIDQQSDAEGQTRS